jgi:hypothetical protein
MSKRIYPKGYDLETDLPFNLKVDGCWLAERTPASHHWPTMLGLLTIISDALAAAPWWGNGEVERWVPEIGSSWVTLDGETYGEVYMVFADGEVMFTDDGFASLADFNEFWRPATVAPTPTADDWIDPAVRLPEVGEWHWMFYRGVVEVTAWDEPQWEMYASARQTMIDRGDPLDYDWRWAPILVGPPPIPDASNGAA